MQQVRPRRARPRHSLSSVIAAITIAVIVVASLGVIGVRLFLDEGITSPGTPPSGTVAEPGAGAGEWQLPERRWEPLPLPEPTSLFYRAQVNGLNAQHPPQLSRCSVPGTVGTLAEWEAAVRDQWFCVHRSWTPTFQRLGWPTTMPEVRFFAGEGDDSACGYLEAPAFYCSDGDGSVHFGTRHFDMARTWDLSVNEMVNHEYAHHLQNLAGITAAKVAQPWSLEAERRAELQATCWSATMTINNDAFRFGEQHYDGWLERLHTMRADGVHGSLESLVHWGTRGLYAETMNDCNTWGVPESHVT